MATVATRYDKELIQKAKALYVIGGRSKDIAQALGINDVTIRQWISRHGWLQDKVKSVEIASGQIGRTANALTLRAISDHQNLISGAVSGIIGKISQSKAEKPLDLVNLANALDKADCTGRRNLGLSNEDQSQRGSQSIHLHLGSEEPEEAIEVESIKVEPES